MKKQLGNVKNIIVLSLALILGSVANAQAGSENGIHVNGGSSSATKISSNIGNSTNATGYNSFASGYASEASGHTSTALGREAKALGAYSGAFGNFVVASANNSFVLGTGFSTTLPLTNTAAGIMMGVNSQQPTLTISAATSANRTGKVAIGNVTSPSAKLHIKADNGERADLMLEATGTSAIYFKNKNNSISLTGNIMTLSAGGFSYTDGNVAIGTMPNNDYKLAVKGVIRSEEVVVELMTSWPDYVFASDYSLPKLNEVKAFVNKNGHLPGLPSASQVSEEGLGLGEINAKLLEKIEELTLYIIEQEERIQKLEEKLNVCH